MKITDILQTFKKYINMSFKRIWDTIVFIVIDAPEILLLFVLFGVIIIFFIIFYCIGVHIRNDNIAKAIVEKDLQAQNYEWISAANSEGTCDYNSAELLARKRADDKYGIGKHTFVSTNFTGKVWYKTDMK